MALAVFIAALGSGLSRAAAQDWTLTKTANPTTYSAVGQVITYTYVVTNTRGDGTLTSLTDDKVASISCPTTSIPINTSLTCTGSYTISAADVTAGTVTNHATAAGDACDDNCLRTATAQATIRAVAPPTASITIVKTASGGEGTFSFTSTLPGAASFGLTTVNGTANRIFTSLSPGSFSVTEVDLPRDWRLATLTCAGNAGGGSIAIDVANRRATINLAGGEAITCTFANVFDVEQHRARTQQVIQRFLGNRNRLLATHEPDRSRFIRRIPGSLWGGEGQPQDSGGNGAVTLSGSDGDNTSRLAFATSLSQMMRGRANPVAGTSEERAMALGGPHTGPRLTAPSVNGFDVWMEGHFSDYRDRAAGTNSKGHFGILYVGADYLLTPAILVGALVQFDWAGESADLLNSSVDGRGRMAGPYVSAKLTQHLYFDARFAWGSSDNSVNPFGAYEDQFSTDRWLAHAKLTGNWHFGNVRITPSLGYTFVEEKQKSYTDTLGVFIPTQSVTLGRLAFGPEIAYLWRNVNGTIWEPHISLQGVWDDTSRGSGLVGGIPVDKNELRGMVQAGVVIRSQHGPSLRVVGSYDGLGSSTGYRDLGGQASVSMPLH